jgi:four helix bundle protein
MQRFTELRVWQRGHELALQIYRRTADFPRQEQFGMTSQMRRAAVSVTSNIAEGAKRVSRPDYARFVNIAEGSLAELESLLRLSKDLKFSPTSALDELIAEADEISRLVYALRMSVEASEAAAKDANL